MSAATWLGLDVGGTKLLGSLVDADGRLAATAERPTGRRTTRDELLGIIADLASELLGGSLPRGVGVGYPGLVDRRAGAVRSSVMLPEVGSWSAAAEVAELLAAPCVVDNDVNCAAVAEADLRGPGCSMVFVTVGTGIGGAVVLGGELWAGERGLAGEIGHLTMQPDAGEALPDGGRCVCGGQGCLHVHASGSAVEQRLGIPLGSLRDQDFGRGEVWAAVDRAARAMGNALGSAINLLDLRLAVVGGGLAELGPRYLEGVREGFAASAMPELADGTHVELAAMGRHAGAVGAALVARRGSPEA